MHKGSGGWSLVEQGAEHGSDVATLRQGIDSRVHLKIFFLFFF